MKTATGTFRCIYATHSHATALSRTRGIATPRPMFHIPIQFLPIPSSKRVTDNLAEFTVCSDRDVRTGRTNNRMLTSQRLYKYIRSHIYNSKSISTTTQQLRLYNIYWKRNKPNQGKGTIRTFQSKNSIKTINSYNSNKKIPNNSSSLYPSLVFHDPPAWLLLHPTWEAHYHWQQDVVVSITSL
jgi:hypothetical protein